jgi:hypothetical protein
MKQTHNNLLLATLLDVGMTSIYNLQNFPQCKTDLYRD